MINTTQKGNDMANKINGRYYSHHSDSQFRMSNPNNTGYRSSKQNVAKKMISKFDGYCKMCRASFPKGTEIKWSRADGATHADVKICVANVEKSKIEKQKIYDEKTAPLGTANLQPVIDFITKARDNGLKFPKLRVLDSNGTSELVLGLTGARSKVPGSVTVKRDGVYVGLVRPTGEVIGSWDDPSLFDDALIAHLQEVAENPAKLAKSYAQYCGECSFCGKTLTDAGSIEVGYGPVCAKNWGLPHKYAGKKATVSVSSLAA